MGRTGVGIWAMETDGVVIFKDLKEGWVCYKVIVGPTSRYFIWGVRGLKVCHGSRWVSQGLSPRYIGVF